MLGESVYDMGPVRGMVCRGVHSSGSGMAGRQEVIAMYRLLVTAGRDLPEPEIVWVPLWTALHKHRSILVTHGAASSGGDLYAHQWFQLPGQSFNRRPSAYESQLDEYLAVEDPHPAIWSQGKIAGAIRNQEMVDTRPDCCYAFPTPKSSGTLDCMARCWVHDIPVWIWHHLDLGRRRRLTDMEGEVLAHRRLGWP